MSGGGKGPAWEAGDGKEGRDMRGEELGRQGTGPAPPITGRGCQSSGREEQRERRPASRIRKGDMMMCETHVAVCVEEKS